MGKVKQIITTVVLLISAYCVADTEVVNGITWTYTIVNGEVSVGGGTDSSPAVPRSTSGSIMIPSTLGGKVVTSIGTFAFQDCSDLTTVTIPDSVTSIGADAFFWCTGLRKVTMGNGVTSIGDNAFMGCARMTNVVIKTGLKSIGERAFSNCRGLTDITIPDSVTSIGWSAFAYCSGLKNVTISSNVTSIGWGMFYGCTGLTSVIIPDSVRSIDYTAFGNCSVLTSVTIGNGLTEIGEAAFAGCKGLEAISIPSAVTSIGVHAFYGCSGLTRVTIGKGVTSIGESAFYGCSALTDVHIADVASWCRISFNDTPLSHANNLYCNGSLITNLVIPVGVTSIANRAFYNCGSITSMTLPDGVIQIGDLAFYGCSGLTSVVIPDSITSIGNEAFRNCSNIRSVVIGNGVTSIGGYVFAGCDILANLTIGNHVTHIGEGAFESCTELTSITLPNSVNCVESRSFYGCSGMKSVTIGNGLTSVGVDAFYGCSGMRNVYISDLAAWCQMDVGNVYATPLRYTNYLYLDGALITGLVIPDGVTSIGRSAFRNCSFLKSVIVPSSVTNIMDSAFLNCSGLTDVTIPDSVVNIGDNAFKYCSGLTNIIFEGDAPTVGLEVFAEVNQECKGVISRSASGWGEQISGNWNGLLITYPWYQVEFDATGGNCEEERRTVGHGLSVGDLPTPVKTGYTFDGWYSGEGSGKSINSNDTVMCDMQLRAYWTPNKYLVTFDANGGVGGTSDNLDYESTIAIPTVTREGYTFKGWTPEVANMVPLEGATYTAQWEINQYTVTFDANGGVGGTSGKQDYGAAIVTPTVTRTGYTFKGWSPSVTATVPANDVTYTAHWEINQYTVTFNANGGTGGKSGKQEYGSAIVAPTVTRTGYTFKGWSPSVVATVPANDVTYVAQWEINQYIVTFNANGGTGGKSDKQEYGSAIAAPTVTRTGYTFKGWSPSVAATVPANDVTYVAQWEINQYTVTFNANGGTGGNSGKQGYGSAIVAPTVTRTGYTFKGWSPSVAATVPANDVTYVAQWEINQYTVAFSANGGTGGTSVKQDYGTAIAAPIVTREGYTFAGWSPSVAATVPANDVTYTAQWTPNKYMVTFDANGGTGGTSGELDYESGIVVPTVTRTGYTFDRWSPNVPATVPLGGGTYTAQWKINQYTVTFNANGGVGGTSGKQDYGTAIVAPTVTREGYTFKGWSPSVAATVPAGNVTYTARWEINKYVVTFDANGGKCGTETTAIEHGSAIGTLPVPTREKAAFLGWFTEVDGGVAVDELLTIMEPITLYAHWLTEVASPIITTDGEVVFRMDSCDVSITCATEGVSIYYTDDGSTPRINDAYLYNGPITISETTTFQAVAVIGDARSDYITVTITKKRLTLEEALDGGEGVVVATSGSVPWYPILDSDAKVGDATARSCEIGDRTNTWLSATVEGAGTMTFWCKVSCEHDDDNTFTWDRLMVYTNGVEIMEWRMDGETGWTQRSLSFDGGTNVVKWVYFKDRSVSEGEDCAWVDGVTWTPADVSVDVGGGKSVMVPRDWITAHEGIVRDNGGNVASALQSMAANGRLSNVECYILGLDPEDTTNDFKIVSFPMKADGTPDIDNIVFDPPQTQWNVPATYKVMGATTLDGPWEVVPGGALGESALPMRFFKVVVELP